MSESLDHNIRIYSIPTPASDEDIAKYSKIRLSSLFTNPEAFSSTFSEASSFSHEKWRERVDTTGRTTIIARRSNRNEEVEVGHEDWIGTISVLHPEMLASVSNAFPLIHRISDAVEKDTIERYLLVGMWVHPSTRKKGIGKKLIRAAMEVVKLHQFKSGTSQENHKTKMVFLEVHTANHTAKGLYSSMGFAEETDCTGVEEGHTCMTITL